jgi:comEA protein
MMNFTPQESRILIFLVAALFLGSIVSLYRHHRLQRSPQISVSSPEVVAQADVLDSTGDEKATQALGGRLNINTASEGELQSLPGIGPQLAERIVSYRQAHGPFPCAHDITRVRGIGEKTYQRIRDSIVAD